MRRESPAGKRVVTGLEATQIAAPFAIPGAEVAEAGSLRPLIPFARGAAKSAVGALAGKYGGGKVGGLFGKTGQEIGETVGALGGALAGPFVGDEAIADIPVVGKHLYTADEIAAMKAENLARQHAAEIKAGIRQAPSPPAPPKIPPPPPPSPFQGMTSTSDPTLPRTPTGAPVAGPPTTSTGPAAEITLKGPRGRIPPPPEPGAEAGAGATAGAKAGSGVRPSASEQFLTGIIKKNIITPEESRALEQALGPDAVLRKGETPMAWRARVLGLIRAQRAAVGMEETPTGVERLEPTTPTKTLEPPPSPQPSQPKTSQNKRFSDKPMSQYAGSKGTPGSDQLTDLIIQRTGVARPVANAQAESLITRAKSPNTVESGQANRYINELFASERRARR